MFGLRTRRRYDASRCLHWLTNVGVAAIVAVLIAVSASTSRVNAQELPQTQPTPVAQYAHALRYFNHHLSSQKSEWLAAHVLRESYVHNLDPRLLVALVAVESSWREGAVSRHGARGLGQLLPGTARNLGVNAREPYANLAGTAKYLASLIARFASHDVNTQFRYAIGAYNAGPRAVYKFHGIPPYHETQRYVHKVWNLWARLADPSRSTAKLPTLPIALPPPAESPIEL